MSVKLKLILLASGSIVGMFILTLLLNYSISSTTQLNNAQTSIKQLNSDMLMLRRNEKDFIARKDLKYRDSFIKNIKVLKNNALALEQNLNEYSINTSKLKLFSNIINEYESHFLQLVSTQQKIGLHPKDGLYGSLRDAVHKVQENAKNSQDYKLLANVYRKD